MAMRVNLITNHSNNMEYLSSWQMYEFLFEDLFN